MIHLTGITKSYRLGEQEFPVLHGIDMSVGRGDLVALTGASGSGKSTLMNILGCLDKPNEGRYLLDGQDVASLSEGQLAGERNRRIGFIFQNFHLLPRASAWANVAQPLIYRGISPASRKRAATDALRRVGLDHRLNHKPSELSGGQRQRVAIARALVGSPKLVLADEPTGNLDSHTSSDIMDLLLELNAEGLTLIIVTHEAGVAARCRRVVRLQDGYIVEDSDGKLDHERVLSATSR